MEIVNPFQKETWRNHPAPHLNPSLVEELSRIGGSVPYGEFKGQSVLRFEWGQSEKTFRCGKMRLKYVDPFIPAQEKPRRYLWRTTTELDYLDRETGLPVYRKEIQEVDECPAVIPAGWFYAEDLPKLTWIGRQLWVIAQWKPPTMLGGEEAWERYRYALWEDPETGKEEMTDMTGPYPRGGRWEPIYYIGTPRTALMMRTDSFADDRQELVEQTVLFYAEPTMQHIENVRRAWREREQAPPRTNEQLSNEAFYLDKQRKESDAAAARETRNYINKEIKWRMTPKVFQTIVNSGKSPAVMGKGV